jgi:hypothetical protein
MTQTMCSLVDLTFLWVLLLAAVATAATAPGKATGASEPPTRYSGAGTDADGFITYTIDSPRQSKPTKLRILLPDEAGKAAAIAPATGKDVAKPAPLRVLYVLPVEAGEGGRFGDGLAEVRKLGLHNRYRLICVEPTFSALPWYADHPTDPNCRQESYLIRDVLPFVERTLNVPDDPNCRLLVGFSKSGWGAWGLLLRHPDIFARAAAWDAPLTETSSKKYGMKDIFASQDNFEKYRITTLLAAAAQADADPAPGSPAGTAPAAHAKQFLGRPARLALHGYGNFRAQHQAVHELMTNLQIPHDYRDGPARKHTWSSGWLADAVEFVAG